jgi:hypothetical protein
MDELLKQLALCADHDDLSAWIAKLRAKRDYLPRCEWLELVNQARRRHEQLAQPEKVCAAAVL